MDRLLPRGRGRSPVNDSDTGTLFSPKVSLDCNLGGGSQERVSVGLAERDDRIYDKSAAVCHQIPVDSVVKLVAYHEFECLSVTVPATAYALAHCSQIESHVLPLAGVRKINTLNECASFDNIATADVRTQDGDLLVSLPDCGSIRMPMPVIFQPMPAQVTFSHAGLSAHPPIESAAWEWSPNATSPRLGDSTIEAAVEELIVPQTAPLVSSDTTLPARDSAVLKQVSTWLKTMSMLQCQEVFDGTTDVTTFLQDLDRFLARIDIGGDDDKLYHLVACLKGEAKAWFRTLPDATQNAYLHLRQALIEQYKTAEYERVTRKAEVYQLQQIFPETFREFVMRVRIQATSLHIPEAEIVLICIRGAHSTLRPILAQAQPKTIEELLQQPIVASVELERTLVTPRVNPPMAVSTLTDTKDEAAGVMSSGLKEISRLPKHQVCHADQITTSLGPCAQEDGQWTSEKIADEPYDVSVTQSRSGGSRSQQRPTRIQGEAWRHRPKDDLHFCGRCAATCISQMFRL